MNKFNAVPVEIDGIRFASKKEGKRYGELKLMERAGVITDLVLQPVFKFPDLDFPREYRADFEYREKGKYVVEDVKGIKKGNVYAMFRIKKALMKYFHKIEVIEI
jgi:hypothetical protein